jgi:hypothetical protein
MHYFYSLRSCSYITCQGFLSGACGQARFFVIAQNRRPGFCHPWPQLSNIPLVLCQEVSNSPPWVDVQGLMRVDSQAGTVDLQQQNQAPEAVMPVLDSPADLRNYLDALVVSVLSGQTPRPNSRCFSFFFYLFCIFFFFLLPNYAAQSTLLFLLLHTLL